MGHYLICGMVLAAVFLLGYNVMRRRAIGFIVKRLKMGKMMFVETELEDQLKSDYGIQLRDINV